jgi:SAM-dependent methyltransferase
VFTEDPVKHLMWTNASARDEWVRTVSMKVPSGALVLDLGAGECRYKRLFNHCDYKAQDFASYEGTSGGLLKDSWNYGKIDYVCDASAVPVPDGHFDAVLCTEVLEHVPEPIRVLQEISRILKPGGFAFITAPLGSGLHQQPFHFYGGYTPHFYAHFFDKFGCKIVSIEPNRRFFALLSQELGRGMALILEKKIYDFHPLKLLLKLLKSSLVKRWLLRLDDRIPVDEFTVGYHVTVQKSE